MQAFDQSVFWVSVFLSVKWHIDNAIAFICCELEIVILQVSSEVLSNEDNEIMMVGIGKEEEEPVF